MKLIKLTTNATGADIFINLDTLVSLYKNPGTGLTEIRTFDCLEDYRYDVKESLEDILDRLEATIL